MDVSIHMKIEARCMSGSDEYEGEREMVSSLGQPRVSFHGRIFEARSRAASDEVFDVRSLPRPA